MGIFDKFSKAKGSPAPKAKATKAAKASDTADKAEAKPAKKAAAVKGPLAKEGAGSAYRILLRPLFTEKTAALQAIGTYSFEVATDANKIEVARAVRDLYGVKPESVRIVNVKGKEVRFGRSIGREKDVKKAMVSLKKGDSITVFEGVA